MKHLIKIESTPHGVLGVRHAGLDQQYCEAGEIVILEWQPDAKWGLQEAHYTDKDGNVTPIDLTPVKVNGKDVVVFTMPAANITIGGTFKMFVSQDWTEGTNPSKGEVLTVGNNGEPTPIPVDELANKIAEGENDLVDAIDRINPFKGWYTDLVSLQTNHPSPQVGDYAYVKSAESTDPAAIYECTTAGSWSDSGRTADTSNVQTFASSQEVNEVHIVNDLTTGGTEDVLSAEQGVIMNKRIDALSPELQYREVEYEGLIVSIDETTHRRMDNPEIVTTGAKVIGKNILDKNMFVEKKILNDSGVEVSDNNSSYYARKIPVHGRTILSSFNMQRVYLYDANGVFLRRTGASYDRMSYTADSDAYFIQIQVQSKTAISDGCIVFDGYGDTTYEDFFIQETVPTDGIFHVYMEDASNVVLDAEIYCRAILPAIEDFDFWEPEEVTDDYKCTSLGQYTQSIPSLNTLGYQGFLAEYFDIYVGEREDGYKVVKTDIGLDSGAEVEKVANPLYSYEFIPPYYNRTVLLSAGMNACEASTYFGIAYFIKALMEHSEDGMDALYKTTRFVVLPVICPTGISHDPLLYRSANNVRINKNFAYLESWQYNYDRGGQYPGDYPDSEPETKALKTWLNKYNGANFWMDCHSDTEGLSGQELSLSVCFCGSVETKNKINTYTTPITNFYRNLGYLTPEQTPTYGYTYNRLDYPKGVYAEQICKIPSIMHEQYIKSTAYGSDGHTNNDTYGIKNYVALIRWYVLIMCRGGMSIIY